MQLQLTITLNVQNHFEDIIILTESEMIHDVKRFFELAACQPMQCNSTDIFNLVVQKIEKKD